MATFPAAAPDTSTPAVILKFDQNVMHHGGLGAIRSLGRLGVPVYGVHEGPWAPAASSRFLRGRWIWHPDAEDVERTLAGLLTLAERIGRRSVLIPTDDAGAIFLAEHGRPLRQAFLFPAPPAGLPRRLAGKFSMHELCREAGLPGPAVMVPAALDEARDFAAGAGYPVIAKLCAPWSVSSAGLRSTSVLHTDAELTPLWHACETAGAGVMLQEFIPAATPGDWFFHGYCGASSDCRPAYTGIKLRSYPAHAGLTSLGCAVANDKLATLVTALLAELSYRGLVDLDLRRDARDGRYKLLDFNPRLARSSGCSGTGMAWTSCSRRTWTSPARRYPRVSSWTAAASSWRTTTRSPRSATGGTANCAPVPGWPRCARSTSSPGSPVMICGRSG